MPHPLDGPLLKLQRAEEHIRDFEREYDAWKGTEPYGASQERDPQRPGYFLLRFQVRPAPDHVGSVFGDAVTNIRASLDHLAYQLALLVCGEDRISIRTAFPIVLNEKRYPERAPDALQSVPVEAWDLIECLQPYHRTDWSELYYLWLINQLANRDKHRTFNYVAGRVHIRSSTGSEVWLAGYVKDGDILRLDLAPADEEYTVSIGALVGIAVENEVISPSGLLTMHHFVRDEVIPLFSGFFDERAPLQPPSPKRRRGRRKSRGHQRR